MASKAKPTFEESVQRLDAIVQELESSDTTLDGSIALYKEGIELLETCVSQLKQAELRVEELRKRSDGVFEVLEVKE